MRQRYVGENNDQLRGFLDYLSLFYVSCIRMVKRKQNVQKLVVQLLALNPDAFLWGYLSLLFYSVCISKMYMG